MRSGLRTFSVCLLTIAIMTSGMLAASAQDDEIGPIAVGSVGYTEQAIIGEMYALLLEDAGYTVERKADLASEILLHQAYLSGDIDVGVQYTGSGLLAMLGGDMPTPTVDDGGTPVSIPDLTYDIVSREFESQYGLIWLDPLGFNNTYALMVTSETADQLGLESISDLQPHASEMIAGMDTTFASRPDGIAGLEATYDLEFANHATMQSGLMYAAVDQGDVDIIAGYATDGRIPTLELVILEDDRNFFPPYYAAPVVQQNLLEADPELEEVLNQLAGALDNTAMAEMNYAVDEGGQSAVDVAEQFLIDNGYIEGESS